MYNLQPQDIFGIIALNVYCYMCLQDYEVDLYLRQKWQDARLQHPDITESLDLNDPNLVKAIWKPEVYFPNAKHAEFQFVTVPNVLIRIKPDGDILYMLRYLENKSNIYYYSRFQFTVSLDIQYYINY